MSRALGAQVCAHQDLSDPIEEQARIWIFWTIRLDEIGGAGRKRVEG